MGRNPSGIALYPLHHEQATQQDACQCQYGDGSEGAERHERSRVGNDDAGVLQSDKGDKHSDAYGDGIAQRSRNAVQHNLAHVEESDEDEDKSLHKQGCHSHLPRVAHTLHQCEGEEGIDSHAGCLCQGQLCHECQQQSGEGGGKNSSREHGPLVHSGGGKDRGIYGKDIAHGKECCDSGDALRAQCHGRGVEAQ